MLQILIKGGLVVLSVVAAILVFLKIDLVRMGGPVMVPILLSSVFSFAIIFEKACQFAKEKTPLDALMKSIFESIERQRIKEAMDSCDQAGTGTARVLKAGIMKYDRGKEEIREAMQDSFLYEIPPLEDKLSVLATIVQVVPLLGFLGTLVGLMSIFQVIQAKAASFVPVSTTDFFSGVGQALVCSLAGFLVTIPAWVAYNYLVHRVKYFEDEMERGATELLNFLIERRMP
jgi:biopolymer transport protein ExbB